MNDCASSNKYYYNAVTGDSLKQAFRDIALKIADLHITELAALHRMPKKRRTFLAPFVLFGSIDQGPPCSHMSQNVTAG